MKKEEHMCTWPTLALIVRLAKDKLLITEI